jgi:hypothetical protein
MPTLEEEQKFERYRINRWLGNGTSGESYEAEDTLLLRKVTLKLIHPWAVLPDSARRQFFREMQGIGRLNHPYLAAVLNYGEYDGRLYVVRRFVSSGSLLSPEGRMWFKPPLTIEDAFHYAHQLGQALHHIHTQGYFHGSLTLANTLIFRSSTIEREPDFAPFLLADVGLANFVRRFGQPLKAPLPITAAPEQLGQRVTPASDQFALAVMLYLWLAGRPPYMGSAEEIEEQKLSETIVPLTFFNSQVTPVQEQVIRRALSVYPEERFPSIVDFTASLLATLAPEPAQANTFAMQPVIPLTEIPRAYPLASLETLEEAAMPELVFVEEGAAQAFEQETIPDTEPLIHFEPATDALLPLLMETEAENEPVFLSQLATGPTPQPQPSPERPIEPLPTPIPDPLPEPLPEPVPEPVPQPVPEPLTEPAPEPLPQPEPDIFQPLPPSPPKSPAVPQTPLPETSDTFETALRELMDVTLPQAVSSLAPVPIAYLLIAAPGEEPELLQLGQEEITIGRGGSDILHLDNPSVSRHHAILKYEEPHFMLFDQRSASGVYVNGEKLVSEQGYVLHDGDSIIIGDYELVFGLEA